MEKNPWRKLINYFLIGILLILKKNVIYLNSIILCLVLRQYYSKGEGHQQKREAERA